MAGKEFCPGTKNRDELISIGCLLTSTNKSNQNNDDNNFNNASTGKEHPKDAYRP